MIFVRKARLDCVSQARALDKSCAANGVELNTNKNIDGALDGTVIGIDLEKGRVLAANAERTATYLLAGCALLQRPWTRQISWLLYWDSRTATIN